MGKEMQEVRGVNQHGYGREIEIAAATTVSQDSSGGEVPTFQSMGC